LKWLAAILSHGRMEMIGCSRRNLSLELETYRRNPQAKWVYSQVCYVDPMGRRMGILRYRGKYRTEAYRFEDVAIKNRKGTRLPAYRA